MKYAALLNHRGLSTHISMTVRISALSVRNGNYADFIEGHTGNKYPKGNLINCRGDILGRHHGIIRYTIEQRKGLRLSFAESMYVCEIDSIGNTITLGKKSELYSSVLTAKDINLIPFSSIDKPLIIENKSST